MTLTVFVIVILCILVYFNWATLIKSSPLLYSSPLLVSNDINLIIGVVITIPGELLPPLLV